MTTPRRASGTRTMLDVLTSWIGLGRTYDDDARDLAAGVPLRVVARRRDPVRGGKDVHGRLVLSADGGEWYPRRGEAARDVRIVTEALSR